MAILSSDGTYVTVQAGDSLWKIAREYKNCKTDAEIKHMVGKLAEYNNISDHPDLIYVGQKIYLISGQVQTKNNNTNQVKINHFGLVARDEAGYDNRTILVTWTWSKSGTASYLVKWEYDTGDGIWIEGNGKGASVEHPSKQATYDAPAQAKKVRVKVLAVSETRTINGKESKYFTGVWSTWSKYSFKDNPPSIPGKPDVSLSGLKLTATIDASKLGASIIQFAVHKDNSASPCTKGKASVKLGTASYEFNVAPGSVYKVQSRAYGNGEWSKWSGDANGVYSDEIVTPPPTPDGFTKCVLQTGAEDKKEVLLEWKAVKTATSYEIEWINDRNKFDATDTQNIITIGSGEQLKLIYPLEKEGEYYYFRLRACNGSLKSGWSSDVKASTNKIPAPPTTWSSNTSIVLGEPLTLYWVHNSTDGNYETSARLRIYVDGILDDPEHKGVTAVITKSTDESERDKTSKYEVPLTAKYKVELLNDIYVATNEIVDCEDGDIILNTKTEDGFDIYSVINEDETVVNYCVKYKYYDGAVLTWDVCTMGETVTTSSDTSSGGSTTTDVTSYSDWSVRRTVYIYTPPTMETSMCNASGDELTDDELQALPFVIKSIPGDFSNQAPISFYISIAAANSYTTVDELGNDKYVLAGETIYSKYVAVPGNDLDYILNETISAGDVNLVNNESYTITVTMAMNSGLKAVEHIDFTVAWSYDDNICEPNAEIIIDEDSYSANIRPYCETLEGTLVEGVTLAVYRRDSNGKFTEIASGLSNSENKFVLDPHPSLDYARYRIVATYDATGSVVYTDLPGVPIGCNAAVIQWDEEWSSFDITNERSGEVLVDQPWTGSMLKIPYNVDVNDRTRIDVELVEYIGREHPVAYHGTHLGETSSWSMVIPKSDKETLYALRRLSVWRGNVYVREPSGTGYWAVVGVTYPLKHGEVTIPISMDITRVEGGI